MLKQVLLAAGLVALGGGPVAAQHECLCRTVSRDPCALCKVVDGFRGQGKGPLAADANPLFAGDATAPFAGAVVIRDANPTKSRRFLALPLSEAHPESSGMQMFRDLPDAQQEALIRTALAAAESLPASAGPVGIAQNGPEGDNRRTQCHIHVHIGRLDPGKDPEDQRLAHAPVEFRLQGQWLEKIRGRLSDGWLIHPAGKGRYHFHAIDPVNSPEFMLAR
jgi:hypothetical protein